MSDAAVAGNGVAGSGVAGMSDAGDASIVGSPDGGPFAPGTGCGRPLPLDQPATRPGTSVGYLEYRVMGTGANLTDVNAPAKAGPRTFWVRVPQDYDPNRRYRVVYLLQSCGSFEVANTSTYPLYQEAAGGTEEAIYVAIDVPENSDSACYDSRDGLSSQEWEAFQLFQDVVDANYCVDPERIYVVGGSFGGADVANMWGCYFAGQPTPPRKFSPKYHVRAQVTVSGGEPAVQPACGGPVAALWIHDSGDVGNPISGSIAALARVGRMNGCDTTYTDLSLQAPWHAEVPAIGNVCKKFTGCPAEDPVVFCTTTGMSRTDQRSRLIPAAKLFFDEIEANVGADGGVGASDAGVGTPTDGSGCRPELPTKCGLACVSLQSDDANCGACAHACDAGSTCGGGKCTAPTQVVQHVDQGPGAVCPTTISLALADATLYWAEQQTGRIMSVPTAGGTPQVVAMGEEEADAIAVRGGRVFWRVSPNPAAIPPSTGKPAIRTRPTQGGLVTTAYEAPVPSSIFSFAASSDGQTVYVGGGSSGLLKVPAIGGATTPVTMYSYEGPTAMAVEGTQLVTLAGPYDGNGNVDVIDLASGALPSCSATDPITNAPAPVGCRQIARGQGRLSSSVSINDGQVYWADLDHVSVNALSPAGTGYVPYSIVTTVGGSIASMALGSDAVFFSVVNDPAVGGDWIGKAALASGSPPIRIARTSGPGQSLVTDGARVYWVTSTCDITSATP
jgi:hypothetical protein